MIEDKEIKKRELKDRIIVTADLDEKNAPRSRRRQNNFLTFTRILKSCLL